MQDREITIIVTDNRFRQKNYFKELLRVMWRLIFLAIS